MQQIEITINRPRIDRPLRVQPCMEGVEVIDFGYGTLPDQRIRMTVDEARGLIEALLYITTDDQNNGAS